MAGLIKSLGPRSDRKTNANTLNRAARTQVVTPTIRGGKSILERITTINALVGTKLGKYTDQYTLLREENEVLEYFEKIVQAGIGAIDTETNSLDPITCTLAGVCLYSPGLKPAYIPLNHVSYITNAKVTNQVDVSVVLKGLKMCEDSDVKWVMHNAKFDIRVISNQVGIEVTCFWDTMLAAKCLNENESASLKNLHLKYCNSQDDEALSYDKLFEGIPFTHIPITTGYLYAAGDGLKTFELYEFQKKHLNRRNLLGPYTVFTEIEMPLIPVLAKMEDTGVAYDIEFSKELSTKYNELLNQNMETFYKTVNMYEQEINVYKQKNPNHKLDDPINIGSPTQIAILLYDIIGLVSPDKGKPRGTGEDILKSLDTPLSQAILDYRGTAKLLSTYIDNLPTLVNPKTGRIHTNYNQYGAVTGRISSSEPNMQNIPSKNKEIRKMFRASEGHLLISADFSQQEPRVLAHMSKDEHLIQAYADGKDIYAWIAESIYNVPYDECKEFRPDGTKNPEGARRRDSVKSILLGIMYGRGAAAIAEQLNVSVREAQGIIDQFFNTFPKVKLFIDSTSNQASRLGYVETAWGRKRRLLDMLLPDYEFSYAKGRPANFDPLAFDQAPQSNEVDESIVIEYTDKLNKCYSYKAKQNIITQLQQQGINVKDNGGFKADAQRQCVNSIIQGTSADITKKAMIVVGNDEKLKEWGCKLLLQVHDEIIVEAPKETAKQCADRVCQLMIDAAAEKITVPMKVDAEITEVWYGEAVTV